MRLPSAAAILLLASCVPEKGPMMAAGRDCISCHGAGGARKWTAAGTWAEGSTVTVTDADGKSVTMRGNKVGNFYTAESLAFPLRATVDGKTMPKDVTYGGCNLCHSGSTTITSELMSPGQDCLQCHTAGGIAPAFSAAGTFLPPGTQVTVDGVTKTTNAVGNFFITDPLGTITEASVAGSTMSPPPSYGGCNSCHGGGRAGDGGGN